MSQFKLDVLARPLDRQDAMIVQQALMLFIDQTKMIREAANAGAPRPDGVAWPKNAANNASALESSAKRLLRTSLASFKAS